jgi:Macrocin-O-methyltransferase (TylF)
MISRSVRTFRQVTAEPTRNSDKAAVAFCPLDNTAAAPFTSAMAITGLLQSVHQGARNALGEHAYARLRQALVSGGITRRLALAEFEARDVGPSIADLAQLDERDKALVLGLGVQYAYYSYVEGDIVEFGTCTGLTARMIARAMIASERDRPPKCLHLFDSFEGHPEITSEIDRNSYEVKAGIWRKGYPRLLTRDELFQSCARILPAERVLTHEGWFAHTIQQLPPGQKFAFIHFHADLYQSAIDAVGGLLKRAAISNGALVCFSGYNTGQASSEHGERGAWKELTDRYQIKSSHWRAYGNLGNSFFIHEYKRT